MRIYLFHLINQFNLGGSTTYLIHLVEQLKEQGYDPVVIKRGKKERVYNYYHVPVLYTTDDKILFIAKHNKSIITYCFWKENGDLAKKLIALNVPIVVHDPAEYHDEWITLAKKKNNTIVIREKNKQNLKSLGVNANFIPHPYTRSTNVKEQNKFAVCAARVDFRKHTIIVARYNELNNDKIDMYGEVNRMYAHHTLSKETPNWKQNYQGVIEPVFHKQVETISQYKYAIDLTAIKNDGGGTQYCFFEAWDSGCNLILNKKWDCAGSSLLHNVNCIFISDHLELKKVLSEQHTYNTDEAKKIFLKHSSDAVIPHYINLLS